MFRRNNFNFTRRCWKSIFNLEHLHFIEVQFINQSTKSNRFSLSGSMIVSIFIFDGYFEVHSFHMWEISIELTRKQLPCLCFERFSLNCHSRMHYVEGIFLPCCNRDTKTIPSPSSRNRVSNRVDSILEHVVEERLSNEWIWSNSILSCPFLKLRFLYWFVNAHTLDCCVTIFDYRSFYIKWKILYLKERNRYWIELKILLCNVTQYNARIFKKIMQKIRVKEINLKF